MNEDFAFRLAIINKAIVQAQIRAMGMAADNAACAIRNETPVYTEQCFQQVIAELEAIFEANRP